MKTALYRHFDADSKLLYVGISLSAVNRLADHMRGSGWSGEIKTVSVEHYDSREDALKAERQTIGLERPAWNKVYNGGMSLLDLEQSVVERPTPEQIKVARQVARLTQTEAGALVHTTCRTWQQWEAGDRRMHPAFWELFQLKTRKPGN